MTKQIKFVARLSMLVACVLPLALSACDDGFTDDWLALPDTVTLYSLSRPEYLGRGSAYDFFSQPGLLWAPEQGAATGQWDFALIDDGDSLALAPAGIFFGIDSRAGVANVGNRTFEEVSRAPSDTADYIGTPVRVRMGNVYVVRTRRENCGYEVGVRYAKLEPVEINKAAGTLRFRSISNPYCNDRRLIPDN